MTITFISIIITFLAIELDKFTRFQHRGFTVIAFIGVLATVGSVLL